MKLGLGLYARMLTPSNLRFARQIGAEAIVVHMADFNSESSPSDNFDSDAGGRSVADSRNKPWTIEQLNKIKSAVENEGLELAALENLNPALWYDILLGGPEADQQLENIKLIIRNIGEVGIPCLGYCFSLAGVWGRTDGPHARGRALSMAFPKEGIDLDAPLPAGWVCNRIYDPEKLTGTPPPPVEEAKLRARYDAFLEEILPVAEESGVVIASHPDDPPLPTLRGTPRLFWTAEQVSSAINRHPSHANKIEFCVGTFAEMQDSDVQQLADQWSKEDRIGYVHFRNVRGKVPEYHEVFIDEGDVDMKTIVSTLARNGFSGVLIPDHVPFPDCESPWHAGMAHALGYMKGLIDSHPASTSNKTTPKEAVALAATGNE